ncbi:hypothetical protein CPS_0101 [Colwellia psychrerythraea 34H]|uniref:Uncharacterized protein n=1 Tax=Colwellia psychrerythraea (strain 34H / ATCC BAA-681) TaxID=167879 RepID=Q48AP4_COLP3|nr:hypothetical protein CPS_0101 [Colwellia psychrerythraea 34H]
MNNHWFQIYTELLMPVVPKSRLMQNSLAFISAKLRTRVFFILFNND